MVTMSRTVMLAFLVNTQIPRMFLDMRVATTRINRTFHEADNSQSSRDLLLCRVVRYLGDRYS